MTKRLQNRNLRRLRLTGRSPGASLHAMPTTDSKGDRPTFLFTRRNFMLLAVAVATVAAGYAVLVAGSASAASVLLVAGYCVLFPLALLA